MFGKLISFSAVSLIIGVGFYHGFDHRVHEYRNTYQLITDHGYTAETHTVETEDGFLIEIYRIPYKRGSAGPPGPPVVLQHGLTACSETWVLNGQGNDLAFLLSDEGFDVWLANSRGNHNTRLREKPPPLTTYWNFGVDEFALYDVPAILDYITLKTKFPKVSFVAHSLGNFIFMATMSLRPQYLSKVNYYVGLTPASLLDQQSNVFNITSSLWSSGELIANNVFPDPGTFRNYVCAVANQLLKVKYVNEMMDAMIGRSSSNHRYSISACPVSPVGSLYFLYKHLSENTIKGKMLRRDFGPEENLRRYNSSEPPMYSFANITTPASFYFGGNDYTLTHLGSLRAMALIPNVKKIHSARGMNHFDIMWPFNSTTNVFPQVIQDLVSANKILLA